MHGWFFIRIIDRAIFMAAIRKRASYANRPDGIQPIRILHNLSLKRLHFRHHAGALERHPRDDIADVADDFNNDEMSLKNLTCRARTDRLISAMELPISDIVKQRGEFNNERISAFVDANPACNVPNPQNVPPIMAGTLAGEFYLYFISDLLNDYLLFCGQHNGRIRLAPTKRSDAAEG